MFAIFHLFEKALDDFRQIRNITETSFKRDELLSFNILIETLKVYLK